MQSEKQSISNTKLIIFFVVLCVFVMWLIKPYAMHSVDVPSHRFYSLGLACLDDFQATTRKSNLTLTNTYAKKISKLKDMVLIRAQNQRNAEQVRVECIYATGDLLYLSVNDQRLELP